MLAVLVVVLHSLSVTAFCILIILFPFITAGKATTDEELEEMLEGGNAAVFTAGVRLTLDLYMP